jgi:nucleoside triphosphate diphosphatase
MPSQPKTPAEPTPGPTLDRALDLVRFLRQNCPWDAAQTPESLIPYLLEEAHEVAEAIVDRGSRIADRGSADPLASELGDLLLNLAFQIVLAEEKKSFDAEAVVRELEAKMRRRHPHLYGDGERVDWETLKAKERAADTATSVLQGVAKGLDPLSKAHRIQERVATVGFDWENARGAFDKVAEELEEVREAMEREPSPALEEELGDLLFAVVNLTRLTGLHSLQALHRANLKFTTRFEALEELAAARGIGLGQASLQELDALWDEVKKAGRAR